MNTDELDAQIAQDSADNVPPFSARAVQLARDLGAAATDLLRDHIRRGGPTAFIALEALRQSEPSAFEQIGRAERARIYADQLRESTFFNAWGLPGFKLTDTAMALIALGEEAVPVLAPLLDDNRPAPSEGSQDATVGAAYGNRVSDYAWVFISEITNKEYAYPKDVAARDGEIRSLSRSLRPPPAGPR